MINYNITISFPLGVRFNNNPKILLYNKLFQMIKRLCCMNTETKCWECPFNENCNYYRLSGKNFTGYPAILVDTEMFEKNFFKSDQQLNVNFYIIGNMKIFADYIDIFLTEYLKRQICGKPFYIIKLNKTFIAENETVLLKELKIRSAIESDDLSEVVNKQLLYYKNNYDCYLTFEQQVPQKTELKKISVPYGARNVFGYI